MTTTTDVTHITFPDGPNGPYPYFDGPARIHKHGHIWLKPEPANTSMPIVFPFRIDDVDYSFVPNLNGPPKDGSLAMSIGSDPNALVAFNNFGAPFAKPILTDARTFSFEITAFDSNKYFYIFNITGPNGLIVMDDPIIVNR